MAEEYECSEREKRCIKGAVESDLMLVQLNLRDRRGSPPPFLDLLKEVREEEASRTSFSSTS